MTITTRFTTKRTKTNAATTKQAKTILHPYNVLKAKLISNISAHDPGSLGQMKQSETKKISKTTIKQMFRLGYKLAFETKHKRKKWDDIFPLWYCAATNGHVRSQFYLATCYDDGLGTKKDLRLAFQWYLKAAKAGHRDSQFNVGFFFGHDEIKIKNHRKKVYWYSKAANSGHTDAQRDLGYSYFYGEGVKKDKKRAVYWYKKAASRNDEKALYNLGLCYKYGDGVQKSIRWSKYYFLKANKFGHKRAKAQLKELEKGSDN